AVCPYASRIVDGLLGSTILGFQTAQHCRNFRATVDVHCSATSTGKEEAIVYRDASVQVRPYPISVEWPRRCAARAPSVDECRRAVRSEFGIDSASQLVISVDRLDYTKGFEERLAAIERLLESSGGGRRAVFLDIACPTRPSLKRYADFAVRIR